MGWLAPWSDISNPAKRLAAFQEELGRGEDEA
jgi:hypothetical protein